MDFDNLISFIPIQESENTNQQIVTRNLSTLATLAGLSSLQQTHTPTPSYSLDSFRIERTIDPTTVNIKEFTANFKSIKTKLKDIEKVINDLENQKELINQTYEDVMKKLVDFFKFSETNIMLDALKSKAFEMIEKLELDKYYEEQAKLLEYYKVAVPLLNQVKQEFFSDKPSIENCHICYDKAITFAIYPCGHTVCEDCRKKIIGTCYLCRSHVIKINKIFI